MTEQLSIIVKLLDEKSTYFGDRLIKMQATYFKNIYLSAIKRLHASLLLCFM